MSISGVAKNLQLVRAFTLTGAALLAFGAQAVAGPVTGPWIPSGTLTVTNGSTASPIFGTGASNSATGSIYANIGPSSLQIGESLTLRATMAIVGAVTTNPDSGIRFGIFNKNGSSTNVGWKGYLVMTRNANGADAIMERSGTGTGTYSSVTSATYLTDSNAALTGSIGNKTFLVEQTIARTQAGLTITVSITQTSAGTPAFTMTSTSLDTTPLTTTFDAVGFSYPTELSPDQVTFSDIVVLKSNAGTMIELGDAGKLRHLIATSRN